MNAILQLEAQGECRESATEAVLMVGYTSEGISNQEQTRWLSWNVDGGLRGHDLARNPGLSTKKWKMVRESSPSDQSASRSSGSIQKQTTIDDPVATNGRIISRSQQHEEGVGRGPKGTGQGQPGKGPSCSCRDQAKLDRDQAILERNKAILDRDLLMAEREQEQRLQESVTKCDKKSQK